MKLTVEQRQRLLKKHIADRPTMDKAELFHECCGFVSCLDAVQELLGEPQKLKDAELNKQHEGIYKN